LGIEPHFDLFQYFFHLKPHPNESKVDVVGGAGLQFHQGRKPKYIPYELSDKVIDWKSMWFYIRNLSSFLPLRTPGPPVKKPSWNSKSGRVDQVNFLLGEIEVLKAEHQITGASVVANCLFNGGFTLPSSIWARRIPLDILGRRFLRMI